MKHERGEAALIKRDGQLLNAIKLYLGIIEKIDLSIILDDMCRIESKNQEVFSSENWEVGSVSAFGSGVGMFDEVLEKACKIAEKKEKNHSNATGDDGWFAILDFLQNFIVIANIKVNEVMQNSSKRKTSFDRVS
jgi:hypothetical protein